MSLLRFVALFVLCVPAPAVAGELDDPSLAPLLKDPIVAMHGAGVPEGFRIILLSNLAEACLNVGLGSEDERTKATACLDVAAAAALEIRTPAGALLDTHRTIVLAAHRRGTGSTEYDDRLAALAADLDRRSNAAPDAHVPSFGVQGARWPADQVATLYALWLVDRLHGTDRHVAPLKAWLAWLDTTGTDAATGLPISEASGRHETSALPRGCAIAWTVRYLAALDADRAAALWSSFLRGFRVERGDVVGFREWPPGVDRPADIDSGPIVFGVGAAATGFAIGASRAVGDEAMHARLVATHERLSTVFDGGLLGRVIALQGRTLPPPE